MGTIVLASGSLRGRRIETLEGEATRPLLTRLRKTLADILRPRLPGARVLDLFGGSGAVTFELLSNGAAEAVVVELNTAAAALIERNAGVLRVSVRVVCADARDAIPTFHRRRERFDLVIVAPPYGRALGQTTVDLLGEHPILTVGGVAVVQRDRRERVASPAGALVQVRTRAHGRTAFDFYEQGEP